MDGALSGTLVRLLSEDGQRYPLWSLEKWRGLLGALSSTEMLAVTNHNPSRKPSAKVLVKATRTAVCAGEDFSYFQPAPPRQGWAITGVDLGLDSLTTSHAQLTGQSRATVHHRGLIDATVCN